MHVLPQGFHRIRYYGLLTSQTRARNIARVRELLALRQCRCSCRHGGLFRNQIPKTQNLVSKNARGAITPAIRIMLRGNIARAGASLQNSYA
jgi:hypothetical protein